LFSHSHSQGRTQHQHHQQEKGKSPPLLKKAMPRLIQPLSSDINHPPNIVPTTITTTTATTANDDTDKPSVTNHLHGDSHSHNDIPRNKNISAITLDDSLLPVTDWPMEIRLLLALAGPTIAIQLGVYLPNFLVASQVGRLYGSVYLGGFTLANMMGNLCNLSLLQGLFSAADTLGPQAYCAKNYNQLGLLAIRGVLASIIVLTPINIPLLTSFDSIMVFVGENPDAASHAQDYYRIFVYALPWYSIYNVTWKFLSAQEIMTPLVIVCLVCCIFVLPIGVFGFLQESWLGFLGSAWTIVMFQASQAILLLCYLIRWHPHTQGTWPGLSWTTIQQAFREPKGAFGTYFCLGLGGMLATSEWIYWESLTLLIGTMGVVPLSVHTIPTQVRRLTNNCGEICHGTEHHQSTRRPQYSYLLCLLLPFVIVVGAYDWIYASFRHWNCLGSEAWCNNSSFSSSCKEFDRGHIRSQCSFIWDNEWIDVSLPGLDFCYFYKRKSGFGWRSHDLA
jgi:hypothetical protein